MFEAFVGHILRIEQILTDYSSTLKNKSVFSWTVLRESHYGLGKNFMEKVKPSETTSNANCLNSTCNSKDAQCEGAE